MRRANIYDKNEPKILAFMLKWKEQRGEDISFDFAVNFVIDIIEQIEETRTLSATLKSEPEQKKPAKPLKRTSNFATDF